MKRLIIFVLFIHALFFSWGKGKEFSFEYPDSIKKNAEVIMLFNHITFLRTSLSDLNEHVHYAVTILSDRGEDYKKTMIDYDATTKITDLQCVVYDKTGKKVKSIKKSDMRDYSAFSSSSFFDDNRLIYFEAHHPEYPYTIEVEYKKQYKGFIGISPWFPIGAYNIGIKEASLTVIFPSDLELMVKEIHCNELTKISKDENGNKIISWKIGGLKPLEYERYAPPFIEQVPCIFLAPLKFSYENEKGEFSSWESMGEWIFNLSYMKDELSAKTKNDLDDIKKKSIDRTDLIKNVYQYMQSKTRYVGIQLGIGGLKPMPPSLVDNVGYGDCKALSYYTKTLLDYCNISSDYTVIGANKRNLKYEDFVSIIQMNHAILSVPNGSDTIWLECTSQIAPFNHLFQGTANRKALLVKNEGSELVSTPKYETGKLLQYGKVELDESGNLSCKKTATYSGLFYDDYYWLKEFSDKELHEYVLKKTSINNMNIKQLIICENKSMPMLELKNEFTTSNYASLAGDRIFIEMNLFSGLSKLAPQKEDRRNIIYIEWDMVYEDQIEFTIPDGFKVELYPKNSEMETDYGNYQMQIVENGNVLTYSRIFKINKGEYKKEEYPAFVEFINNVAGNDDSKLIIKKE